MAFLVLSSLPIVWNGTFAKCVQHWIAITIQTIQDVAPSSSCFLLRWADSLLYRATFFSSLFRLKGEWNHLTSSTRLGIFVGKFFWFREFERCLSDLWMKRSLKRGVQIPDKKKHGGGIVIEEIANLARKLWRWRKRKSAMKENETGTDMHQAFLGNFEESHEIFNPETQWTYTHFERRLCGWHRKNRMNSQMKNERDALRQVCALLRHTKVFILSPTIFSSSLATYVVPYRVVSYRIERVVPVQSAQKQNHVTEMVSTDWMHPFNVHFKISNVLAHIIAAFAIHTSKQCDGQCIGICHNIPATGPRAHTNTHSPRSLYWMMMIWWKWFRVRREYEPVCVCACAVVLCVCRPPFTVGSTLLLRFHLLCVRFRYLVHCYVLVRHKRVF